MIQVDIMQWPAMLFVAILVLNHLGAALYLRLYQEPSFFVDEYDLYFGVHQVEEECGCWFAGEVVHVHAQHVLNNFQGSRCVAVFVADHHASDDNAVAAGSVAGYAAVADLAGANWDVCRAEIGFQHVHELNCSGKATEGEILWLAPCLLSVSAALVPKLSNVNLDWY